MRRAGRAGGAQSGLHPGAGRPGRRTRNPHRVKGALLVAPGDVERADIDPLLWSWPPIPLQKLPFRSVLLGSRNDPWCDFDRARQFATAWGAQFIDYGEAGHINAEAGLGSWPEGYVLLDDLMKDASSRHACASNGGSSAPAPGSSRPETVISSSSFPACAPISSRNNKFQRSLAAADRPGDRRRLERQGLFDLVQQFERIAALAVELIDEGDDRDVAQPADFEQFSRARLYALGGVDDHDGGVDRRQRAIGVFRKVLVARRVQQVEDAIAIFEGHHRGDDGNAALALYAHPVGAGLRGVALGADLAGELNRAAEQQQLFGQRGLAGVGMRNNREGAPPGDRIGEL